MTYNEGNLLDIVRYFADEADNLETSASKAVIFDNPVDRGDVKETILWNFLENHLPRRCGVVRGGYVFNQFGNRSKQIDLLVTYDSTIQFKQVYGRHETKSFNSIEGTLAAISVKTNLDKQQFLDALDNLASIPTTPRAFAPITMGYDAVIQEMIYKTPYKVIFAFKGLNIDSVLNHLEEYIRDKKPDDGIMPDLIIVNKSYFIYKISVDGEDAAGGAGKLPQGSYRAIYPSNRTAGISLMRLVSEIQMVSNFTSLVLVHFNMYELTIQHFLRERKELPPVFDINRDSLIGTDEDGTSKPNEKK
jgi:hypothetical protein